MEHEFKIGMRVRVNWDKAPEHARRNPRIYDGDEGEIKRLYGQHGLPYAEVRNESSKAHGGGTLVQNWPACMLEIIGEPKRESEKGWIEWSGGECPVPLGQRFQCRLRSGVIGRVKVCTEGLRKSPGWNNEPLAAYRILDQAAAQGSQESGAQGEQKPARAPVAAAPTEPDPNAAMLARDIQGGEVCALGAPSNSNREPEISTGRPTSNLLIVANPDDRRILWGAQ